MKRKLGIVVTALALIVIMATTLCACSSYGSIKSAFKKEGYKEVEISDTYKEQVKSTVGAEYVDKVTIHVLAKESDDSLLGQLASAVSTAIIVEFKSNDDMVASLKKDLGEDTVKEAYEALQKLDTVNGNCTIISLSPEALKIFKSTK